MIKIDCADSLFQTDIIRIQSKYRVRIRAQKDLL